MGDYPNQDPNQYGQQPPYGQPNPYGPQNQYGPQNPYGMQNGFNPMMQKPSSNLVWAILCTIFCCLPLGIVAIVKASKVDGLWAAGDFMGAQKASNDAKNYSIWGAVASVILCVIYVILIAIGVSDY